MKHIALAALLALVATPLLGHCDSIAGPVVVDARQALESGSVDPVLKWVSAGEEKEIREAFAQAVRVRSESPAAAALADRWFFETVVRIHRQGEGAPFTGLKGEGFQVEKGIELADRSVESGSLDAAEKAIVAAVTSGLRERFAAVRKAREHAEHNAGAGRQYVHAYVEFIHYAERLHQAATTRAAHAAGGPGNHEGH